MIYKKTVENSKMPFFCLQNNNKKKRLNLCIIRFDKKYKENKNKQEMRPEKKWEYDSE